MELFSVGAVEITARARVALADAAVDPAVLVARHQRGDWGEVDEHDRAYNEFSLRHGHGFISLYRLPAGVALAVRTTADRSRTLVFLDEEYQEIEASTLEGYAAWA